MTDVFVGLGSNLGDRWKNLTKAIKKINAIEDTKIVKKSSFLKTKPHQAPGPDYLNGVVKITTNLNPEKLLDKLKEIEERLGRKQAFKNAPRIIDLDILLYGKQKIKTNKLTIPHPGIKTRNFLKKLLLEIEPNLK
ncbi:MAG: 2-amino-4-hydroxy-6-hydroxymethyldihydropteridine diphosphokinase [Candidatus Omnitrophica bacterium]|nr:2-amino-4-hydroxy-6-hydroxymethyldihydropteridine diphosphokinase [Candidatus Omnitrophota bacterium]MCF7878093.1 2-amino-4-hydroxy-6-hydroxymethyldihydropteridine diphosphokinase [Candidatus Omnitrophota bacterium]MCF7893241.1 2-amino-4-hydroxy-6-hydroxymethyldihydropteridine diphosphokinase [Candidatus Omnitrophota bacterium]